MYPQRLPLDHRGAHRGDSSCLLDLSCFDCLKLEKERDRRPEASFTKVSVAMDRLGFLNLLCTLLCLYSLRQLRLQQS
jgi:hypothetical protein